MAGTAIALTCACTDSFMESQAAIRAGRKIVRDASGHFVRFDIAIQERVSRERLAERIRTELLRDHGIVVVKACIRRLHRDRTSEGGDLLVMA